MPELPLHILTTAGFIAEFEHQITRFPTRVSAFEYVNALHEQYFRRKKYSNYDSFRNVMKKRRKVAS